MDTKPTQADEQPVSPVSSRPRWRWLRRTLRSIIFLFSFLVFLIFLILYSPTVQTWLVKEATKMLSQQLRTQVSIDRIDFNLSRRLSLREVYVEDVRGDTLLFADKLKVAFASPLLTLFNGNLYLDEVELSDAQFRLQRDTSSNTNNLAQLLSRLAKPNPDTVSLIPLDGKKPKTQLILDLEKLRLNNVDFYEYNQAKGNKLNIHLDYGLCLLKNTDIAQKLYEADLIHLRGLNIKLLEGQGQVSIDEYFRRYPPVEALLDTNYIPLRVQADRFWVEDGSFIFDNERRLVKREVAPNNVDVNHLRLHRFQLDADRFQLEDLDFKGKLNELSVRDSSGFELSHAQADSVHVSYTEVLLANLLLETPNSRITDTLQFTFDEYPAFEDFENRVNMNFHFTNSEVALRDVMAFVPKLQYNPFFVNNANETIRIDGRVTGLVNDLRTRGINVNIGNKIDIQGDFDLRDVTDPDLTFFYLNIQSLNSRMRTLMQLLPDLKLPSNFNTLGKLGFTGNAAGFTYNFVASGNLLTDIGNADMDMQFIASEKAKPAEYSGNLSLQDFQLDAFTGDSQFGEVSLQASVRNGRGLTAKNAYADLSSTINFFEFREYRYENIDVNGQLNQDFFKGDFTIDDEHVKLDFNGNIENITGIPEFDILVDIEKFDLYAVNIIKHPFSVSGLFDLNLLGSNWTKLYGQATIDNLELHNDLDTFFMSQLYATSTLLPGSKRQEFILDTDIANARAWGRFDLALLHTALFQHLYRHHDIISGRLGLPKPDTSLSLIDTDFAYEFDLIDAENLPQIFNLPIQDLRGLSLKGQYRNTHDVFVSKVRFSLPHFIMDKLAVNDLDFRLESQDSLIHVEGLQVGTLQYGESIAYDVSLAGNVVADSVSLQLQATNQNDILSQIDLDVYAAFDSSEVRASLRNEELSLFDKRWAINPDNLLRIGAEEISVRDFILTHENQRVALQPIKKRGVQLTLDAFDLSYINDIWDYKPLNFYGQYKATIEVQDIFEMRDLSVVLGANEMLVNSDNWGALSLRAATPSLKEPVAVYMHIGKPIEQRQLVAKGQINLPGVDSQLVTPSSFDFDVNIENYPLRIAEFFIGDLISNTTGRFDANARIWGPFKKPNINGTLSLTETAELFVEYLQIPYTIEPHTVKINNFLFDATGATIRDPLGNPAYVTGGMTHNHLKKLGLDVSMTADKFLALNTKKGDNSLFYGKATAGDLSLSFKGVIPLLDLNISGRSLAGTRIYLPFGSGEIPEGEESFIRFVKADSSLNENSDLQTADVRGLNINMQLNVTEEAMIYLIFDEKSGDIIQGRGNGNLNLTLSRSGDFSIRGDYTIVEGEYLFTLYDLVNKPFTVKEGGTIRWNGDPYTAQIDIDAVYQGVKTPLSTLLAEYLTSAPQQIVQEASQSTQVDLILHLKGELMKPDITFEIEFPELIGSLRNIVDSRMAALERNPNAMNYQVFGLIVTNSFLPTQSGALLEKQYVTGINTVSELLSNQLSRYLTGLVSEIFTDVSFISSVDMDIAANYYEAADVNNIDNPYTGTELGVASNFRLINDKVVFRIGGNYSQSNAQSLANNQLFSYDVLVEVILTKNRRYRLRFFHRTEPEITGGLETITGIGISYRKEFNTLKELFSGLGSAKRKKNKK